MLIFCGIPTLQKEPDFKFSLIQKNVNVIQVQKKTKNSSTQQFLFQTVTLLLTLGHTSLNLSLAPLQEVAAWRRRIQCESSVGFIAAFSFILLFQQSHQETSQGATNRSQSSIETRIWHKGQYYLYVIISPFYHVFMLAVWENKKIRSMNLPFLP